MSIKEKMHEKWTPEERIAMSQKYKDIWDEGERAAMKRVALEAGLDDKYRGCYTGRNQTIGDLAKCFEKAADSAGIDEKYRKFITGA